MDGVSMAKICARIKCCRCLLSAVGESQAKNKNAQPKAERSNASATCMFARTANGTSAAAHKKSGVLARDREDFARHVGREVAGEENHHLGDFPRLGVAYPVKLTATPPPPSAFARGSGRPCSRGCRRCVRSSRRGQR